MTCYMNDVLGSLKVSDSVFNSNICIFTRFNWWKYDLLTQKHLSQINVFVSVCVKTLLSVTYIACFVNAANNTVLLYQ